MVELTTAQQGTLVVCAINFLPHRDDLIEKKDDFGCCPDCCAGCGVLKDLIDAGTINDILRLAPPELQVTKYDWWDWNTNGLDLSLPDAWWNLYPCPNHEDLGDD